MSSPVVLGGGWSRRVWAAGAAMAWLAAAGVCAQQAAAPAGRALPGGRVYLHRQMPAEIIVGRSYDYTLTVVNGSDGVATDVTVESPVPANVRIEGSRPKGQMTANGMVRWSLDRIGAGESLQILVRATATAPGRFNQCERLSHQVIAESCAVVVPVSPRMQLLKAMPATAMLCDAIPVVLTVRNTGDTILRGIRIQDTLPEGMTTLEGHPAVLFEAGAVEPGQSREFRFNARVERTGTFTNRAVAVCDEGLRVDAAARVTVGQPILTLEKRGPDRVFIGRRAAYDITVANRGDATAYGLTVRDELPAGVEVTEVSRGGQIQGNAVVWAFEQLPPNGAARVSVALRTSLPMELRNRATAVARCAEPVSAGAVTEFAGVPALLLEVIDVDDPIEVGSAEIYEVTVTNQGTMTATNVRIACTLEDNMAFVSATGPTGPTPEGQTVSFAPLPTLAPKERVTWRIHVNAIKEGDVRFQVEMICDQLTRMVRETEATNVY